MQDGGRSVRGHISRDSVVVAVTDQISADLAGEAAILNLASGVYYGLDPVGARVWRLIREPQTLAHIESVLLREYDVDANQCALDLLALIEALADEGLVQIQDAAPRTSERQNAPPA